MSLAVASKLALNKKREEESKNGITTKPALEKKVCTLLLVLPMYILLFTLSEMIKSEIHSPFFIEVKLVFGNMFVKFCRERKMCIFEEKLFFYIWWTKKYNFLFFSLH